METQALVDPKLNRSFSIDLFCDSKMGTKVEHTPRWKSVRTSSPARTAKIRTVSPAATTIVGLPCCPPDPTVSPVLVGGRLPPLIDKTIINCGSNSFVLRIHLVEYSKNTQGISERAISKVKIHAKTSLGPNTAFYDLSLDNPHNALPIPELYVNLEFPLQPVGLVRVCGKCSLSQS